MTKQDFEFFARAIATFNNHLDAEHTAWVCNKLFSKNSARFDSKQFFKDCGLDENGHKASAADGKEHNGQSNTTTKAGDSRGTQQMH